MENGRCGASFERKDLEKYLDQRVVLKYGDEV